MAERLHRQLKVLAGEDHGRYHDLVDDLDLREELSDEHLAVDIADEHD